MKRTILFKAKRLDNSEWVEGDLLHKDGKTYIYGSYIDESGVYIEDMPVDPSTVCQYTGLKDKDGKEVWEGDYLKPLDGSETMKVIFKDGSFGINTSYCGLLCFHSLACYDIKAEKLIEFELADRKEGEV